MTEHKAREQMKRDRYYVAKLTLFFTGVGVLIFIAMTSFWLQRTIFDTRQFTTITTTAFTKESSRQSVAQIITDRIFAEHTALRIVFAQTLSQHIATLLGTDIATQSVTRAAQEAQLLVTSPRKSPVVVDLTAIKTAIVSIQNATGRIDSTQRINVDDIPDSVVILDTEQLPNFYGAAVVVMWLGPLSLAAAVALFGWWVYRGRHGAVIKRLQIVLLATIAVAGIILLVGPLVEPVFVSVGRDATEQTLLRNIYEGFIAPFNHQAIVVAGMSISLLFTLTIVYECARRYALRVSIVKK